MKLTIEIWTAAPIRGVAVDEDGTNHAFVGWLGLISEIVDLVEDRAEGPEAGSHPP